METSAERNTVTYNRQDYHMLSDGALKWLEQFCISKETAEHFQLEVEDRHFPELKCQRKAIKIPYFVNGTPVGFRWVDNKENWTSDLTEPHLFNIDNRLAPTLFVCDNELAVMALHGAGINAVCPSDYSKPESMPEVKYLHDVLVGFTEVCLLFSKTQESVAWERELSKLFVNQKAFTTRFPDDCITVFDVLSKHGKEVLRNCLADHKPLPIHGVHSFMDFWEDIKDVLGGKSIKLFSTGWPNVDRFFKMQLGSVNVIHGTPGTGKSEWVDHLMLNMIRQHGWKAVFYSPENFPVTYHFSKLAEKITSKPMWGHDKITYADAVQAMEVLQPNIKLIVPEDGEKTVDDVLDATRLAIMRWGINAIVIDPVNCLDHEMRHGENEHQYIGRFLSMMRTFARINNIWVGLVAHPVKMQRIPETNEYQIPRIYDLAGSSNWANRADNIICIYRKMVIPDGIVHVYFQKIRSKYVGKTGEAQFTWQEKSGLFIPVDEFPEEERTASGCYMD